MDMVQRGVDWAHDMRDMQDMQEDNKHLDESYQEGAVDKVALDAWSVNSFVPLYTGFES